MSTRLVAALLIVGASGCRMCSHPCDYAPAVAGSAYNGYNVRAGSAFTGEPVVTSDPPQRVTDEPPTAPQPTIGP